MPLKKEECKVAVKKRRKSFSTYEGGPPSQGFCTYMLRHSRNGKSSASKKTRQPVSALSFNASRLWASNHIHSLWTMTFWTLQSQGSSCQTRMVGIPSKRSLPFPRRTLLGTDLITSCASRSCTIRGPRNALASRACFIDRMFRIFLGSIAFSSGYKTTSGYILASTSW